MSDANAPDSSIVEKLKKLLAKYGTELLKPYVFHEELFRRLDKLEHVLSNTRQDHKKLVEMFLEPSKEALITKDLIKHSELEVRVSVASCISQIIRITAPDEPFGDDDMKEFFQIAISAFERLPCMYGRTYSKAMSIIHTMSVSESCVMMLDLGLYSTVRQMFHLFLDGIRTKHPEEIFSSMEKIMTATIHNNVDNDEFSLVLVKILLSNLRRENQKVAPVSFKLAENTLKNCSANLKLYLPEAVQCLDVPVEDYAEVVTSLFEDATQRKIMDSKDSVENVSCPVEHTMHMQQEQKPQEVQIGRKRNRRPNSLKKAEEGYDPFWMLIDWRSLKSPNKKKNITCPAKTKILKDLSPKPSGEDVGPSISPKRGKMKKESKRNGVSANKAFEPTSEGKIVVLEGQTEDISVKCHSDSEEGQGSLTKVASVKKSRGKAIVSEDVKEDILTLASQCRPMSSQAKSRSVEVSKQNPKGSVSRLRKRLRSVSGSVSEEVVGCRIKVWWPLDQKYYKGTIRAFDPLYKTHQVDYDDGEIEILDLTKEVWKLLRDSNLSAHEPETETGATSTSSRSKLV